MALAFERQNVGRNGDSTKIPMDEKQKVMNNLNNMQMTFIRNNGQMNSKVKYYTAGKNFGVYFTQNEVALRFIKDKTKDMNENSKEGVLKLRFIDANPKVKIEGLVKGTGKVNYMKGTDPKKWYTDVPVYEKVIYKELWQGIDLVFYGGKDRLKYEFTVHPKGDVKDIQVKYEGAEDISIDESGDLLIHNELGTLRDEHPISYQEIKGQKVSVDSKFILNHHKSTVGFEIEKGYNPNNIIVIDPGLIYSTYLGGTNSDQAFGIAIDTTGSAYVTTQTFSTDFPTTAGVFQPTFGGGTEDVAVTKLNSTGTGLIYSTYLGGNARDISNHIAVDNAGNAYVTGSTNSTNFPTTPGAFQTVLAGIRDAFITKLNATGTALVYSTYLGGSGPLDIGIGITIDNVGNAYVTGETDSTNFPTTPGAFQTVLAGIRDAFVTKLNATGSALIYSTYLGGSGIDNGEGISVNTTGNAYVTGGTRSTNFPTSAGAFQTSLSGSQSAFVTALNTTGTALVYSTYLGGNGLDSARGIAVDNAGNAHVTGSTNSTNFPTTPGAFQPTLAGERDVFVTKLNAAGNALIFSTYLGGSNFDEGIGIDLDISGNVYITGETNSTNFPIISGAVQPSLEGPRDAFISKFNSSASLIYSTYLGGNGDDRGLSIAADNDGNAYVTGSTNSTNFPTSPSYPGAFQPTLAGNTDAFVTKLNTC